MLGLPNDDNCQRDDTPASDLEAISCESPQELRCGCSNGGM